jgi:hypothetical protein
MPYLGNLPKRTKRAIDAEQNKIAAEEANRDNYMAELKSRKDAMTDM